MRSQLMPILIVLFVLLLIVRISITVGQKRRKRLRILRQFVAARHAGADEFEQTLKEVRRAFSDEPAVIAALDRRDITEAIRAMCRKLKMDPATMSLNLTD